MNDNSKPFGKYATDYYLVAVGLWDDSNGGFTGGDAVRVIGANEVIIDDVFTPATQANGADKRVPM